MGDPCEMIEWTNPNLGEKILLGTVYNSVKDCFENINIFGKKRSFHIMTRTEDDMCDQCYVGAPVYKRLIRVIWRIFEYYILFHHTMVSMLFKFYSSSYFFGNLDFDYNDDVPRVSSFANNEPAVIKVLKFEDLHQIASEILGLHEHVQLKILSGHFILGKYHNEIFNGNYKVGLLYRNTEENIKWMDYEYTLRFCTKRLASGMTHFVGEIEYGQELLLTFDCDDSETENLKSKVYILSRCIRGECETSEFSNVRVGRCTLYEQFLFGRQWNRGTDLGTLVGEIKTRVDMFSKRKKRTRTPLKYKLYDLRRFLVGKAADFSVNFPNLVETNCSKFRYISDYGLNGIDLLKLHLEISKIVKSKEWTWKFLLAVIAFQKSLLNALSAARSQSGDPSKVKEAICGFENNEFYRRLCKKAQELQCYKDGKILEMSGKGVKILPETIPLPEEYVVFFSTADIAIREEETWKKTFEFFNRLVSEKPIPGRPWAFFSSFTGNRILVGLFRNNKMIIEDMMSLYESIGNNVAENNGSVTYMSKPRELENKTATKLLALPCPSSKCGGCEAVYRHWSCAVCGSMVKYLPAECEIVCDCGWVPLDDSRFNCKAQNHSWPRYFLQNNELQYSPRAEANVLLLGEIRSGKSTLINALANYMAFESLDQAERGSTVSLIPTAFTLPGRNLNEIFELGQDENEVLMDGAKHTLHCRSYLFPSGDDETKIRFIDTPGFSMDHNENATNSLTKILNFAGNHGPINSICIVIKGTNDSLPSSFQKTFSLLFSQQLPNTTINNVNFIFTHVTRRTVSHKLMLELKSFLSSSGFLFSIDQDTFYMNNDVLHFLILKSRTEFLAEKTNFSSAWDNSSTECARLIQRASSLKPFDVRQRLRYEERFPLNVQDIVFNPSEVEELGACNLQSIFRNEPPASRFS